MKPTAIEPIRYEPNLSYRIPAFSEQCAMIIVDNPEHTCISCVVDLEKFNGVHIIGKHVVYALVEFLNTDAREKSFIYLDGVIVAHRKLRKVEEVFSHTVLGGE